KIIDRAIASADAADGQPRPHGRAVLAYVALVSIVTIDLAVARQLESRNAGGEIVRVGDVLERFRREFAGLIAENAAQRFVDPEPRAVSADMRDPDRRTLERDPEPCLAFLRAQAFADVSIDIGRTCDPA